MNFLKNFFHTDDSTTHLIIRLMLGLVIFIHGAQKLFGWFGGHGFDGTMGFFTEKMGIPALIAFLVIIANPRASRWYSYPSPACLPDQFMKIPLFQ